MEDVTQRDVNQISKYEHDQEHNAKRVVIVGGSFEVPKYEHPLNLQQEVRVIEVEKPIIVKEYEVKIVEVEKQVLVQVPSEIRVVEVEKPVIVIQKEIETKEVLKDFPLGLKVIICCQALVNLGLVIKAII